MANITYNGVSSADLGVIIEAMPTGERADLRYTSNDVPGHYGSIYNADEVYENYEDSIKFNCFGNATPRDIYRWLQGEGYMTDSDEPTLKRYVRWYKGSGVDRLRRGAVYDGVEMKMICDPFRLLVEEEPLTFDDSCIFDGNGDMSTDPLLAITGRGARATVILNGTTLLFDNLSADTTVYVDCESKQAYTLDDGDMIAHTDLTITNNSTFDRWPRLRHTANLLTLSGVASITITPRWRFF